MTDNTRYHVNWNSGMPTRCSNPDCTEEHRSDPVAASRDIYEAAMVGYLLPPTWTRARRPR